MTWPYYLDESGDAPVPPGYLVVEYEVDFLREALTEKPLFVKGRRLCSWAEGLCKARKWPYEHRASPAVELRRCFPGLTDEQAPQLVLRLGESLVNLSSPLREARVAALLWPEFPWDGEPGPTHAARWLLWLTQSEPDEVERVVLESIASVWGTRSSGPEIRAYAAVAADQAWILLKEWLRVSASDIDWPPFPLPELPLETMQRLQGEWRLDAIESKGGFFDGLRDRSPQGHILEGAASVAAKFYLNSPQWFSEEKLRSLRPHLAEDTYLDLLRIVPPADPGECPEDLEAAIEWFRERYLPFRQWESLFGASEHHARVREVAGAFGRWYLELYSWGRTGGPGSKELSWSRAASLDERSPGHVTLLVVLDGLGYADSEVLLRRIRESSERLVLDSREVALAPLPTITHFAKPALLTGLNPSRALDDAPNLGSVERRDANVVEALSTAEAGEVVIWSLLEPDTTYHRSRQDLQVTLEEVRAELQGLANRIVKVAHQIPAEKQLRVVVSTDHGRLLGASRRTCPVPNGMEAHGRAAWGALERDFPAEGYLVEDEALAYLHAGRFGLDEHCAVLLSDESFLTSDGRGGSEYFPHGGLYPEEVLIPWMVFTRDRSPLRLTATLGGRGVAGAEGKLRLSVSNPSDLPVELVRLEMSTGVSFDLAETVGAMSSREFELTWETWPGQRELGALEPTLRFSPPSGDAQTLLVDSSLESEELYVKDDILGDLGGLDEF